jgi:hypothetical protein
METSPRGTSGALSRNQIAARGSKLITAAGPGCAESARATAASSGPAPTSGAWRLISTRTGVSAPIASSAASSVGMRSSEPVSATASSAAAARARTGPASPVSRSSVSSWKTIARPSAEICTSSSTP